MQSGRSQWAFQGCAGRWRGAAPPHSPSRLTVSPVVPQKASDLVDMINRVIREGLEGLVLKDVKVRRSLPPLSSVA